MNRSRKRALCWLYAALMTAAVMAFVLLCTDVYYANNDDPGIMRAFLGYENGKPAHFQLFIHGLLAWPLSWLGTAFPGLPWFSYVQMGLLALGCLVIAKSVMQSFVRYEKPLWTGAVLALLFVTTLCMKYISVPTFTQTAAILGAAAVAQMFSVEHDRGAGRVLWGMMGSLVLLVLCYALREMAALPALAFCGLAFVILCCEQYLPKKRSLVPMVISAVAVLAAMGAMAGLRTLEIQASGAQDYIDLQNENTQLLDYYGIANVPQEALDQVGWSPATFELAKKWCFFDESITTEAFRTITAYMNEQDTQTLSTRLQSGWATIQGMMTAHAQDMRCLALALVACLLAAIGAVAGRRPWYVAALGLTLLGAAGMLVYLSMRGRMPLRAMLTVLLPAAALLFVLLPACLPRKLNLPACLLCVAYAAWCLSSVGPQLLKNEDLELELGSVMGDLEEYALGDPESLFIYDETLVGADLRVFPSYPEGIPHNVTSWGGWGMRSPQNHELFESFDLDIDHLAPEDFLRDDVYVASGRLDPPPMLILNWLQEKISPDIEWEIESEYGMVYIFHFYEP